MTVAELRKASSLIARTPGLTETGTMFEDTVRAGRTRRSYGVSVKDTREGGERILWSLEQLTEWMGD